MSALCSETPMVGCFPVIRLPGSRSRLEREGELDKQMGEESVNSDVYFRVTDHSDFYLGGHMSEASEAEGLWAQPLAREIGGQSHQI